MAEKKIRWFWWSVFFVLIVGAYLGVMIWVGLDRDATGSPTLGIVSNTYLQIKEYVQSKMAVNEVIPDKVGMPIYYINLDRSEDRRTNFESELGELGLTATRIQAVDGKLLDDYKSGEIDGLKYKCTHEPSRMTELACTLSHLKAIRTAHANGDQVALFMEDDASWVFYKNWEKTLGEQIRDLEPGWKMLSLFDNDTSRPFTGSQFYPTKLGSGLVAYVLNREGMTAIVEATSDGDSGIRLDAQDIGADRFIPVFVEGFSYTVRKTMFTVVNCASTIEPDSRKRQMKWAKHQPIIQKRWDASSTCPTATITPPQAE